MSTEAERTQPHLSQAIADLINEARLLSDAAGPESSGATPSQVGAANFVLPGVQAEPEPEPEPAGKTPPPEVGANGMDEGEIDEEIERRSGVTKFGRSKSSSSHRL